MTKADIMSKTSYKELGEILGYRFDGTFDESETGMPMGDENGDALLFMDNYARITCRPLREIWEEADSGTDWYELDRLSRGLKEYKSKHLLLDYTDLLTRFVERGKSLPVSVAIIDEAQDLSRLQWHVLRVAFKDADRVYIAGDDDQSIYRWSGADLDTFLRLGGEKEILSKSFRLPRLIHKRANDIISGVPKRFDKPFSPRDSEGVVDTIPAIDYAEFTKGESTMILVRNVYLLTRVQNMLKGKGLPFVGRHGYSSLKADHIDAIKCWEGLNRGRSYTVKRLRNMYDHMKIGAYLARGAKARLNELNDKETLNFANLKLAYGLLKYDIWHSALEGIELEMRAYYLSIMHSGRKLTDTPEILIQTIHGVKGGEADHVVLLPDMSKRTFDAYQRDPTDEMRVAYVAVTRARNRLSLVAPSSQRFYPY